MNAQPDVSERKQHFNVFWKDDDHRAIRLWWQWLAEHRGDRARLRRCDTSAKVLAQYAFHRLCQKLPWWEKHELLGLAIVGGVLAHVESIDVALTFPAQMGSHPVGGEKPTVSELRFQQLISSTEYDELFDRLRRAIQLVGNSANILSLADGVFHWSRERRDCFSEKPSRRFHYAWSKAYFNEIFTYTKEATS